MKSNPKKEAIRKVVEEFHEEVSVLKADILQFKKQIDRRKSNDQISRLKDQIS